MLVVGHVGKMWMHDPLRTVTVFINTPGPVQNPWQLRHHPVGVVFLVGAPELARCGSARHGGTPSSSRSLVAQASAALDGSFQARVTGRSARVCETRRVIRKLG